MSKIKILSLALIVIGFLYLGSSFTKAATITVEGATITVEGNAVVEVGGEVTVVGTYTSSEALGLDREICIRTRRSPAGRNNFEQLGTMCENVAQINLITGGTIRRNVTLPTEGDYQFRLINRLKTDTSESNPLATSSIIQVRSDINDIDNDNDDIHNINSTNITIDQTSRDFGERDINPQTPYSNDVSVSNGSSNEVTITYTLSGDSSFSIGTTNTVVRPILPNIDDVETITFYPLTIGLKQANLNIKVTNSRGRELINQNVSIAGTGRMPAQNTTAGPTVNGSTSGGGVSGGGVSLQFLNPLGGGTTTITGIVKNIINGIFGLLGAIAVAMIVYGGVIYMTGGSSKDGVEKGKKIITSAVVGLVIVLLSLAIIDLLFVLLGGR